MRHILVTGGNGFVGRYVVGELQERGFQVAVLDRHQHHIHPSIKPPHDGEHYFGDIKDATLVTDAVSHVDGVIHLAGILGTQETVDNPIPAAETNILGGLNVIQACAQYDVPLVNIAVGNYWEENTYSISKNTVERFVTMSRKYRGKAMMSVRALNAYGPGQVPSAPYGPSRVRKIMPSFICRALEGQPIEVYGSGDQIMDMIHARDVAQVLVNALVWLRAGNVPRETPEAGTGRPTTVNEIATIVRDAVEEAQGSTSAITHLPMRPGESSKAIVKANPGTLVQLGMDPSKFTKLEAGVAETVKYFKERLV